MDGDRWREENVLGTQITNIVWGTQGPEKLVKNWGKAPTVNQTDGWWDEWIDEYMDSQVSGWKAEWMDWWRGEWMDGWTDRWTDWWDFSCSTYSGFVLSNFFVFQPNSHIYTWFCQSIILSQSLIFSSDLILGVFLYFVYSFITIKILSTHFALCIWIFQIGSRNRNVIIHKNL